MSPAEIAATHPDKPAYIMAETGETITSVSYTHLTLPTKRIV